MQVLESDDITHLFAGDSRDAAMDSVSGYERQNSGMFPQDIVEEEEDEIPNVNTNSFDGLDNPDGELLDEDFPEGGAIGSLAPPPHLTPNSNLGDINSPEPKQYPDRVRYS